MAPGGSSLAWPQADGNSGRDEGATGGRAGPGFAFLIQSVGTGLFSDPKIKPYGARASGELDKETLRTALLDLLGQGTSPA